MDASENWMIIRFKPNQATTYTKMDVHPNFFLQIILAAKWLVRHSNTPPKQQRRPLHSLLSHSSSMSLTHLRWASSQMSPSCRWSMWNDWARFRPTGSRSRLRENRFERKFFLPAIPITCRSIVGRSSAHGSGFDKCSLMGWSEIHLSLKISIIFYFLHHPINEKFFEILSQKMLYEDPDNPTLLLIRYFSGYPIWQPEIRKARISGRIPDIQPMDSKRQKYWEMLKMRLFLIYSIINVRGKSVEVYFLKNYLKNLEIMKYIRPNRLWGPYPVLRLAWYLAVYSSIRFWD